MIYPGNRLCWKLRTTRLFEIRSPAILNGHNLVEVAGVGFARRFRASGISYMGGLGHPFLSTPLSIVCCFDV